MYIEQIKLTNYRNYDALALNFSPKLMFSLVKMHKENKCYGVHLCFSNG